MIVPVWNSRTLCCYKFIHRPKRESMRLLVPPRCKADGSAGVGCSPLTRVIFLPIRTAPAPGAGRVLVKKLNSIPATLLLRPNSRPKLSGAAIQSIGSEDDAADKIAQAIIGKLIEQITTTRYD